MIRLVRVARNASLRSHVPLVRAFRLPPSAWTRSFGTFDLPDEDETVALKVTFKLYDINKNRELDFEAFCQLTNTIGMNYSESEARDVFASIDENGDGKIQLHEWVQFAPQDLAEAVKSYRDVTRVKIMKRTKTSPMSGSTLKSVFPEEEETVALKETFSLFDINRTKELDRAAFKKLAADIGMEYNDIMCEQVFNEIDTNGDGLIQLEEWVANAPQELADKVKNHRRHKKVRVMRYSKGSLSSLSLPS
uniref:EF-hand domain-containing protein n=1 Tax=Oxyrrhis marina TaxID=2969 RepID=A0A7S4LQ89_OXYMA|mmetsp:Transcript_40656/g.97461  ORF Transcript_40656/g.97461 Transcript_40656/m.97461 type:complete len:249 (-) Transcript_40656:168-914(-)